MQRRRALVALVLVVGAVTLAGCTNPTNESPVEQSRTDSPPCARLTLQASSTDVRLGENVTLVARIENCGSNTLSLPEGFCGGWTHLNVEGPLSGRAGSGPITTGFASCGPIRLHPQPLAVEPATAVEREYWWNGTMTGACSVELGKQNDLPRSSCPWPQPAPAGEYRFSVHVPLQEQEGMQAAATANVSVNLQPWNITRGRGAEISPSWQHGPATVTWRNATGDRLVLAVPESMLFSSDGANYLYVIERHALGGGWPLDCQTTRPQGVWVLVDRSACIFRSHPSVWCTETAETICSTVASEGMAPS